MSDMTGTLSGHRHYLPHNGQELPGAPPPDASSPEVAERNAETFVRQMIVVQKREENQKRLPPLSPAEPSRADAAAAPARTRSMRTAPLEVDAVSEDDPLLDAAIADLVVESEDLAENPDRPRRRLLPTFSWPRLLSRPEGRAPVGATPRALTGYRPTRKHVILAVLALIMVLRPLLIPLVVLVTFWVVLIAYLTVGPDRWTEIIAGAFQRYAARKPEKAERLRLKADAVAIRIDRLLDWLPDSWADRLSLPDFSQPFDQAGADERPDPFDRLAAEARKG